MTKHLDLEESIPDSGLNLFLVHNNEIILYFNLLFLMCVCVYFRVTQRQMSLQMEMTCMDIDLF